MEFYDYKTLPVNGAQVIDPNKTGMSFYDQFLTDKELDYLHNEKNLQGTIVMMSPEEYYEACSKYGFSSKSVSVDKLKRTRRADQNTLNHLKDVLLVYKKRFPLPMLNIAEQSQEGLHRMMVIGDLFGWDHKVPVLVVTWYDEDRAKREAEAKHKYDIDYNVEKAIQETCYYTYYSVEEIAQQLQHELFRRFEYRDSVKVPDEIELKETSEGYTFTFEGYEYTIDKDDVELKDEVQDDLDDIDVEDLETTEDFLKRYFGDDWRETHSHLKDTFGIKESVTSTQLDTVKKCAKEARQYIVSKYGTETDLCGRCIEASDYLADLLNINNIKAKTVEGYIVYDDDSNCSDRAWDEHTWVELDDGTVVDVTVEQFNYMMYEDYPPILIEKNPHGYVYDKPKFTWLDELNESAEDQTVIGLGIKLRNEAEKGWTKDTCHPAYRDKWSIENPSIGQCAITAMWLNENQGWDIYETIVNRSRHFFNKDTNGFVYDLTADQFQDSNIDYENSRKREFKDLYKSCRDRFELFKNNLEYNN